MIHLKITVGIGQCSHASHDGGRTWTQSTRDLPSRHQPLVRGRFDVSRLPSLGAGEHWDFVSVLSSGFGAAVSQGQVGDKNIARIIITKDGGLNWELRRPEPKFPWLRLPWNAPSWPVDQFDSLVISKSGHVALAWEDPPGLYEGSQSHVIHSSDGGQTWGYACLGFANPYLALDFAGNLLSLNDGFYLASRDGGQTWTKQTFSVESPTGRGGKRVAMLRHVTFVGPRAAYALLVHWPCDQASKTTSEVGLLTSGDGGDSWGYLRICTNSTQVDMNERHVLDLQVSTDS